MSGAMLPLSAAAAAALEAWAHVPLLAAHMFSWLRTGLFVLVLLAVICLAGLVGRGRLVGFVALHVASYAANLTLILMVACDNRPHTLHYLWALLPAHLLNGAFSFYMIRSSGSGRGRECERGGRPLMHLICLDFLVMGLLQGAQVKLAIKECQRRRQADRRLVRFHCKAVDGILEGTTFGFVASYMLLKQHIDFHGSLDIGGTEVTWWRDWQNAVLQAVKWLSLLNVGLATMEVDHWTSSYVRQQFAGSIGQVRHLSFRAMEFALRLCTLILLCICVRQNKDLLRPAVVLVAVDYLVGVVLLIQGDRRLVGRRLHGLLAALMLGLAFWMVNILQFSDGRLRRPAKRITCVIVPWRTLQCLAVLAFLYYSHELTDLWKKAGVWLLCLAVSAALYYLLLITYAMRGFRRGEDLLGAVEQGNLEVLRRLPPEALPAEVNYCGPDGFNAVHLAAKVGRVDFLAELCDAGAELSKGVGNRTRNTAFHIATMRDDTVALRLLCEKGHGRLQELLALNNSEGDTVFHLAAMKDDTAALRCLCGVAQQQNLQALLEMANGKGETALHKAVSGGGNAAAELLCGVNWALAFVNAQNRAGDTALHLAARSQSAELVSLLLARRVDRKLKNGQQKTAYDVAWSDGWAFSRSQEGRVVELLREPTREAEAPPEAEHVVELPPLARALPPTEGQHCTAAAAPLERCAGVEAAGREQNQPRAQQEQQQPPLRQQEEHRIAVELEAQAPAPAAVQPKRPPLTSMILSAGISPMSQPFLHAIQEDQQAEAAGTTVDAQNMAAASHQLDEYTFVKPLGSGSFGEVSLVQRDNAQFAMKRMEKPRTQHRGWSSRVQRELQLLKRVVYPGHRFIVHLHSAFETEESRYLILDYCCNRDLEVVLRERGDPGLDLKDVARLTGEVLLALEFLHCEHVMMRDLKPDNVVLDAQYRARITDFGLAKLHNDDGGVRNTDCGTPGYVAPEVRTTQYGFAADVYSFGTVTTSTGVCRLSGVPCAWRGDAGLVDSVRRIFLDDSDFCLGVLCACCSQADVWRQLSLQTLRDVEC